MASMIERAAYNVLIEELKNLQDQHERYCRKSNTLHHEDMDTLLDIHVKHLLDCLKRNCQEESNARYRHTNPEIS